MINNKISPSSRYYQSFVKLQNIIDHTKIFKLVHNSEKDTYSLPYIYGNYKNELDPIVISNRLIHSIKDFLDINLFSLDERKLLLVALRPYLESFGSKPINYLQSSIDRIENNIDYKEIVNEYRNTIKALEQIKANLNKNLKIENLMTTDIEPTVFISYTHDSKEHIDWVIQLATRLRSNGVNVLLDKWNLTLGSNLTMFMEQGLSNSQRIICVCSSNYVEKANNGKGGAGYEKQIITAELINDQNTNWIIPLIKSNSNDRKTPIFLGGRIYINFDEPNSYEAKYEELLRDLLEEPVLPIPPIGKNPFQTIKEFGKQKFIPANEKYCSPAIKGLVTFDYSNNNGRYFIGQGELLFEISFSKSSNVNIHLYNDSTSINIVAIAKKVEFINQIKDARIYDGSSRVRIPRINEIAILQNINGFYAAIKILSIKDDTRNDENDEVTFEYVIQTNGSPDFTSHT